MRLLPRGIRLRITLCLLALLVVVQVGAFMVIRHLGSQAGFERTDRQLETVRDSVEAALSARQASLVRAAGALAASPALREAARTGNARRVQALLQTEGARAHADLVGFVSADGNLALTVTRGAIANKAFPGSLALSARDRPVVGTFADAAGVPHLIAVARAPGNSPGHRIAVGLALDERLAASLGWAHGIEVSVATRERQDWRIAWTTGGDDLEAVTEAVTAALAPGLGDVLQLLRPRTHGLQQIELPPGDSKSAIVLRQPIGELERSVEPLQTAFALVTGGGMLVFMIGSALISASITRPIRELAAAAHRVRSGDGKASFTLSRRDEIGELAASLEHMRQGMTAREQEVSRLAYSDTLTGLANRACFAATLERTVADASASRDAGDAHFAVLLMDLDRFKWVNDTLGHECGDQVLAQVADRLRDALPGAPTIARLGGDEFAIVVRSAEGRADDIVARISRGLESPITLAGQTVDVSASIGIAHFPEHGRTPSELMRHADVAMYAAKRQGVPSSVYDPGFDTSREHHLSLLSELRNALDRPELRLLYQPKISLREAPVVAAEVLMRWEHPTRGLVTPDDFIPFAEKTGFIREMTQWLLQRAIRQAAVWRRQGREVELSINISARDLIDQQLPQRIASLLTLESLPPRLLCLEVTESALIEDPDRAADTLQAVRKLGVQVAVDDYGSGFSSLTYLKRLSVTELKIDKSFVAGMTSNAHDSAIVRSTIELGHSLGLSVTAEGVETEDQLTLLEQMGCDKVQGFLFSPGVSRERFEATMTSGPAGATPALPTAPFEAAALAEAVHDAPAIERRSGHGRPARRARMSGR
ncbi:putative bifunctional diguanylate cyclase/phosphodiesterase [Zeimonas arvi]|uniref:EAL domain-containing protein n=1 Tax=Zeimonas arvi TaxID=2498847 RepID=A0A5C8NR88_9BURK|nr:EAL domain-containing protein [Zeimonas arvi]TXL63798.1 EAL domain-containing protein [Zeimonas arvi]